MKILTMDNEEMVQAIAGEDRNQRNKALKLLYSNQAVNNKIKALVNNYNLTRQTSDDILQEGIILLDDLIRRGKFRGDSKVSTFLIALCRNLIRDSNKKVERIEWRGATIQDHELLEASEEQTFSIELIEHNQEEKKRDNELKKVLEEMAENCREALTAYYFKNQNMTQIAELRGLANKDQAKKTVYRCRKKMRDIIVNNPVLSKILNLKK